MSEGIDWGASGRIDSYDAVLVDPFTLAEKDPVEINPSECSVSWIADQPERQTARLSLINDTARDSLVRIYHTITIGGYSERLCVGTFFPETSGTESKFGVITRGIAGYSTLRRHHMDQLIQDHRWPTGANCCAAIEEIIEADGGHLVIKNGVDKARCFGNPVWFQRGENKLEVIETIAGWIGAEIGVDSYGNVLLKPYISPTQKPSVYTFTDDRTGVLLPGIAWTDNRDGACNRVTACYSGSQTDTQTVSTDSVNGIAAAIMQHLVTDPNHGYSQGWQRYGNSRGYNCDIVINNKHYYVGAGDYDCSSAVIKAWQTALIDTAYEGALNGATYTGDMSAAFVASGLFTRLNSFTTADLNPGDVLLNDTHHTAMYMGNNQLAEFNISETGGIYGAVGDQTGNESRLAPYYSFPWNCALKYNGGAGSQTPATTTKKVLDYATVDLPPTHAFSFARIGRHVTRSLEISDVGDATDPDEIHAKLVEAATRELETYCGNQVHIRVRGASVPGVNIGDVVTYRNSSDHGEDLNLRCLVVEKTVESLNPWCMTDYEMVIIQ